MRGYLCILLCVTTTLSNPAPPQIAQEEYTELGRSAEHSPQGRFLYPFGPYVLSPLGQGLLGLSVLGLLLSNKEKEAVEMAMVEEPAPEDAVIDPESLPEARSLQLHPEGRILYPFGPYVLSPLGHGLLVLGLLGQFLANRKKAKEPIADMIATEAEAEADPQGRFLYPFGPYVLTPLGAGLAGLGLGLALIPSNPKKDIEDKGRNLLNALAYEDLDLEEEFALEEEFLRNLEAFEDDLSLEAEERLSLDSYVDDNLDDFIHTGRALDFVQPEELDDIIDREVDAAVAAGLDLDRNGDGVIDRNEFHWTFPQLDLYEEFGRFDTDNSGFIEAHEI